MSTAATALTDAAAARGTAEEVLAAAREGDHAAWDWIFDRYYRTVLRYCVGRLGLSPHAEDAAQEVFVAAVSSLGRLRDASEAGVEGWLLGIARHKCVDHVRALRRDRSAPASSAEVEDASELALGRLTSVDVRAAIEQLGAAQREVVIRRFVLGQSLDEVAAATRRPVGAVKSMQHRAIVQLAKRCAAMR